MKINIKGELEKSGMSRYELAKRIGVSYPTIDSIYKGNSLSIKFEILEAICRELNCTLDDILVFDDNDLRNQQIKRISSYLKLMKKVDNKGDTE